MEEEYINEYGGEESDWQDDSSTGGIMKRYYLKEEVFQ